MEKLKSYRFLPYFILSILSLLYLYGQYGQYSLVDLDTINFDTYIMYDGMIMSSLVIFVIALLVLKGMDHKILKAKSMPLVFIYFLPLVYLGLVVYLGFRPYVGLFMAGAVVIQLIGLLLYIKYNNLLFEVDQEKNFKLVKNSLLLEIIFFIGLYLMVYFIKTNKYIYTIIILALISFVIYYLYKKGQSTVFDKIVNRKVSNILTVITVLIVNQNLRLFNIFYIGLVLAYFIYRFIRLKNLES